MSELTKIEELKQKARKVYSEKNLAAVYDVCCEFEDLARELLALRSLRDAGDEEVYVCLRGNNVVYQNRSGGWDSQLVYPDFCRLRDIAITRGQQLHEAREEIENLKLERDGAVACMDSRLQQIATLTAERDEARSNLEKQIEITYEAKAVVSQMQKELAALARRSIASREEVVGLLDHILSCIITVKQENTPEWMEYIVEEVNKVNEAIGDPDRVALSLGNIVIVKGCPEIVEGM